MSLSEAVEVLTDFMRKDAKSEEGHHPGMTRREIEGLARLLSDARITLDQISHGVIRREGRRV